MAGCCNLQMGLVNVRGRMAATSFSRSSLEWTPLEDSEDGRSGGEVVLEVPMEVVSLRGVSSSGGGTLTSFRRKYRAEALKFIYGGGKRGVGPLPGKSGWAI